LPGRLPAWADVQAAQRVATMVVEMFARMTAKKFVAMVAQWLL
jgi:hypothetical protein